MRIYRRGPVLRLPRRAFEQTRRRRHRHHRRRDPHREEARRNHGAAGEAFADYDEVRLGRAGERIEDARACPRATASGCAATCAYDIHDAKACAGIVRPRNSAHAGRRERGAQPRPGDMVAFVANRTVSRSPACGHTANVKNVIVDAFSIKVELTDSPAA